jgi:cytochrome P450
VDGRRLTPVETRSQLVFLFISGNETTRPLIGNLLSTIVNDPALLARLNGDRSLITNAVEESLRHDPPVQFLMRNCMHDTTLHDQQMCPRDTVAFGIASANRDEANYVNPDDFLLDRPDIRSHLAFGGGPHVCPGAALARLEARVAAEVFLDRVAAATPVHPGRYENVPVTWARGPRHLKVQLSAR